jgi:hydroxymethylbilane synthase
MKERSNRPGDFATKSKDALLIGSRGSKLALWQAEHIKEKILALHPQLDIRIEIIKTSGDRMANAPLSIIGGRGVFTKELEEALLAGRIDLAVHSLKDLPTVLSDDLFIAVITEREDARDALVIRSDIARSFPSLEDLPEEAIVGTSSLRRLAQLKHLRPSLAIKDLRGNVDTRLRKLDAGEYDAIVLASAGLLRLGFSQRINQAFAPQTMLPAIGQGALAIETRADDETTINLVAPLDHAEARAACTAERAFLRALGGGCQLPIAAHAMVYEEVLRLDGLVASPSGERIIRDQIKGATSDAVKLGETLALRLLDKGAQSLLGALSI